MPSDNFPITPGSGESVRVLVDAQGNGWPAGVTCYATTVSAGANVLQIVDATHGLPVSLLNASVAVTAAALPLPAGAATSAAQATAATTLTAIAASVSGVVNVRPASPTAADYLPVRLSDGTSFYTASGGSGGSGGQQYAEDAAHASGDLGTVALAVRKDTAAQLAGTDGDYSVLLTDASGRLHVNVGNAVAVTGTFWQTTQPVSGTVTANAGTGTFAVSAASLPLPSGASTSAKQPALGTAGSASADVLTVQGVASMTALKVDGSAVTQPVSAASLPLPSGASTSAAQTTGNASLTSIDGKTPALGQALAAASVPVVLTTAQVTTLTPPAAITGFATETTLAAQSAKLPTTLGQKAMAASLAVAIASDQGTVPVSLASVPSHAVTNVGTFAVQAAQSGTWNVGTVTSITSVSAVTAITNALPAGTNLLGKVGIDQTTPGTTNAVAATNLPTTVDTNSGAKSASTLRVVLATDQPALTNAQPVSPQASASGGWTPALVNSAATTNATNLKASAGQVGVVALVNNGAGWAYLKFYDSASAPTAGSGTPVAVVGLPPGGGSNPPLAPGLAFASGIGYTITGGAANSDATAVAANQVVGTIGTR